MINEVIAVNIHNFTLNKNIAILKNDEFSKYECENIDKLPQMLYNLSKEKDIKSIAISGPRELGIDIARQVRLLEIAEYGSSNLDILVV